MIQASICTIGDEILIGQIVDTNSAVISRALGDAGIAVHRMVSIPDSRQQIISLLKRELMEHDIVISTGGLGPTKDDITKDALSELSGSTSYRHDFMQEEIIRDFLHSRGLDVLDINIRQADVPDKCEVILNRKGTAPIMVFRFDKSAFGHDAVLYALPGVPYEAEGALGDVMDDIRAHFKPEGVSMKTIMVYGIAESALSKKIEKWEDSLPSDMHLAYLPNVLTGIRLRLSATEGSKEERERRIEERIGELKPLLGQLLYSEEDDTLQNTLKRLLHDTGKTLCAAESCTGGEIAHMITSVSGSSGYFLGSVTSYSETIKEKILGVRHDTIEKNGIVSAAVASEMAEGVKTLMGSTYSVATTGWADSTGDEKEPAGTVWIAVSGPHGTLTERHNYRNDRIRNIQRFAATALDMLRRYIISEQQ